MLDWSIGWVSTPQPSVHQTVSQEVQWPGMLNAARDASDDLSGLVIFMLNVFLFIHQLISYILLSLSEPTELSKAFHPVDRPDLISWLEGHEWQKPCHRSPPDDQGYDTFRPFFDRLLALCHGEAVVVVSLRESKDMRKKLDAFIDISFLNLFHKASFVLRRRV